VKRFEFRIDHPGEMEAGQSPYTDHVTVIVAEDDSEGFDDFLKEILEEWYAGAKVFLMQEDKKL